MAHPRPTAAEVPAVCGPAAAVCGADAVVPGGAETVAEAEGIRVCGASVVRGAEAGVHGGTETVLDGAKADGSRVCRASVGAERHSMVVMQQHCAQLAGQRRKRQWRRKKRQPPFFFFCRQPDQRHPWADCTGRAGLAALPAAAAPSLEEGLLQQ